MAGLACGATWAPDSFKGKPGDQGCSGAGSCKFQADPNWEARDHHRPPTRMRASCELKPQNVGALKVELSLRMH